jgi:hypothetical protein
MRSIDGQERADITFLWGLKRSGIHLVAAWLYANHGGAAKDAIECDGLHAQLCDGYVDQHAGVAFHNNCGGFHSRRFALGDLAADDFGKAARRHRVAIFGLEDCDLRHASVTEALGPSHNVIVLRDPLNNLASRLEGATARRDVFRVDEAYIDLFAAYCEECLGASHALTAKTVVNYNRFVQERPYRDAVAEALGLQNRDAISEVSSYGGGSSFSGSGPPDPTVLLERYRERPVPPEITQMLLARPAIREACSRMFGFDLAARCEALG